VNRCLSHFFSVSFIEYHQPIGNTKCILNAAHMQNRTSSCQREREFSQSVYVVVRSAFDAYIYACDVRKKKNRNKQQTTTATATPRRTRNVCLLIELHSFQVFFFFFLSLMLNMFILFTPSRSRLCTTYFFLVVFFVLSFVPFRKITMFCLFPLFLSLIFYGLKFAVHICHVFQFQFTRFALAGIK